MVSGRIACETPEGCTQSSYVGASVSAGKARKILRVKIRRDGRTALVYDRETTDISMISSCWVASIFDGKATGLSKGFIMQLR